VAGLRTTHPDFGAVTGVVEAAGKLWMGTINFPAVAHVDLAATRPPPGCNRASRWS
jgi:hypothetical protein